MKLHIIIILFFNIFFIKNIFGLDFENLPDIYKINEDIEVPAFDLYIKNENQPDIKIQNEEDAAISPSPVSSTIQANEKKDNECNKKKIIFKLNGVLASQISKHSTEKKDKEEKQKLSNTARRYGKNSYICDFCQKVLKSKSLKIRHMRIHTFEKPFQCDFCPRGFSQKNNLERHMRIHTGEKPFKCNYCEKYFRFKESLTHHLKIHTGEKSHKCNFCQKAFSRGSSLKKHIEAMH